MSVVMQAPQGVGSVTIAASNSVYTPNPGGQITALNSDVPALLALGFSVVSGPANFNANPRNMIDGGDFSTNPWQRNVPGLASGGVIVTPISNTPTYFADRFFAVGGASSAILMAAVADTSVLGFSQSLKLSRQPGNANTAAINFGQALETADSVRAQGQQVTLSFWAKQGANYSGGALSAAIVSGAGANQSAASLVAGSWTSQSSFCTGSISLTTAMTRYSITGNAPANATQLAILLSWTPSGTAGADDSVTVNGVQLEIGSLSAFEHKSAMIELDKCLRYAAVFAEPASGVVLGTGAVMATNSETILIDTDSPFWKAPSVTVSIGTFKINSATGGLVAATALAGAPGQTPNGIVFTASATGTAGQAALLQGGGGSGYIVASADL